MDPNTVISVVVPLQNDAKLISKMVDDLDRVMEASFRFFEIILVDDGSTDDTRQVVAGILKNKQRIRYQRLSRSFGRDICLSAGIESAIGDFVCTLNPRTDPVDILPQMIQQCRQLGGIIHGIAENPLPQNWIRGATGSLFRRYCRKHLGVEIKHGVSDLRVMSRQAVNALLQIREQSRYLRVLTLTLGYHQEFFPYRMIPRSEIVRQEGWRTELITAIDLLAANTRHPLRLVTMVGLLGAFLNLAYAGYVVVIYLSRNAVAEGWTTLSLQISGMFFLVCLILAVMSEYVGAILGEVRSRPLYFIADESNSSVLLEDTVRSSIVKESTSI